MFSNVLSIFTLCSRKSINTKIFLFILLRGEENCYKNVGEWEGNGLSVSRVVLWLLVIKTMATYQEKVEQQASGKRYRCSTKIKFQYRIWQQIIIGHVKKTFRAEKFLTKRTYYESSKCFHFEGFQMIKSKLPKNLFETLDRICLEKDFCFQKKYSTQMSSTFFLDSASQSKNRDPSI